MARFLVYALGVVGLVEVGSWILGASGLGGNTVGTLIYAGFFALALLSVLAAAWLVFDTVRRFIRCRMTRTA